MTSLVRYNTNLQVFLTHMFIYLVDNHTVTYEEFNELMDIDPSQFSKFVKIFTQMLNDLHIHATLLKDSVKANSDNELFNETSFKTNVYYFQMVGEDYSYSLDGVSSQKFIQYSMMIVYLMLKNHQYVSTEILGNLFPNFTRKTSMNLFEKLSEIVPGDIYKNELKSYILDVD